MMPQVQAPKLIPWPPGDSNPDAVWARLLLPPVPSCTLRKDEVFHHRWSIKYGMPGAGHTYFTKTWNEQRSPMDALKMVLQNVWDAHQALDNAGPPFSIADLPDIVEVH